MAQKWADTILKDFSEEELQLLQNWALYNIETGEIYQTDESIKAEEKEAIKKLEKLEAEALEINNQIVSIENLSEEDRSRRQAGGLDYLKSVREEMKAGIKKLEEEIINKFWEKALFQ